MQVPTNSELLAVWERARGQPITTQALMLLEAASANVHREDLAKLSVGQRDGRLLALREALFGSRLTGVTVCPQCGQRLELDIQTGSLRTDAEQLAQEALTATSSGYQARFRLPNNEDLAAIAEDYGPDESLVIQKLLSRCLFEVERNDLEQQVDLSGSLPMTLVDAIAAEMEKADPQANVQLALNCANCGHRWLSAFDIVSFLWIEIDDWARRVLGEVCSLASAFGWREADILTMSAQRRQVYLQMISEMT